MVVRDASDQQYEQASGLRLQVDRYDGTQWVQAVQRAGDKHTCQETAWHQARPAMRQEHHQTEQDLRPANGSGPGKVVDQISGPRNGVPGP
eukprot:1619771-Heterocapsa_arctica.AAC.1